MLLRELYDDVYLHLGIVTQETSDNSRDGWREKETISRGRREKDLKFQSLPKVILGDNLITTFK